MIQQNKLHQSGNSIGLFVICLILLLAFYRQILSNELPCPLCLLQRLCYIAVGICFCMNLVLGSKPSHYGVMLLAAILGLIIALRQIFIHTTPGDLGYGSPLLGLHLYKWSAIIFIFIIVGIASAFLLENGFVVSPLPLSRLFFIPMFFFLLLIIANGISTFLECGASNCRDNPLSYYLLETTG